MKPDVVCFLDLPPAEAEKRGQFGKERYEQAVFQENVRETYKLLEDDTWKMVDAASSVDAVHQKLVEIAMETIGNCKSKPLSKLWTHENDIK